MSQAVRFSQDRGFMRKNIERDQRRYKRKHRKRLRKKSTARLYKKSIRKGVTKVVSSLDQMKRLAKETFRNMPEEVCQLWLYDRVADCGWPPAGLEWQGFLFGRSIEHWQSLNWEEKGKSIQVDQIAPISLDLVTHLVEAHEHGANNMLTMYMPDSKSRYDSINSYLSEHCTIPGKIILLDTESGYEIVDGAHRVTAALMYQVKNPQQALRLDVWIGKQT